MMDLDKQTLILSDDKIFYTIEGEGEYVGLLSHNSNMTNAFFDKILRLLVIHLYLLNQYRKIKKSMVFH